MSCPICYEDDAKCKLICGHTFHQKCIKEWYMNGNNTGCPMCRNNIYFKGMRRYTHKWDQERREQQCSDVYAEAVKELMEEARESPFIHLIFNQALQDLEEDYVKFKDYAGSADELRFLLANPEVFYQGLSNNVPIYHEQTSRHKPPKTFARKAPRQRNHRKR